MTDAQSGDLWIAALSVTIPSLLALIGTLVTLLRSSHKTASNSKETLEQVKNSHTSNLREDLDEKFAAIHDHIHGVDQSFRALREDVHLVRDEARDDRGEARETRRQIRAVDEKLTTHLRDMTG